MWSWIIKELYNACQITGINKRIGIQADDVVQDVCMQLLQNPKYAEEIYENEKAWLLVKLVKSQIYDSESKLYFDNKMDFSRYQKIIAVCDEYGIEPIAENAYKISSIMDNSSFGIPIVATLLSSKKPVVSFVGNISKSGTYLR